MRELINRIIISSLAIMLSCLAVNEAHSTASTHIWAPSTDTQDWKTGHVTADIYVPVETNRDGSRARTITDEGLEFGLLPFNKLRAEAGFDFKTGYGDLDSWPMYFNGKLAIPEDSYGKFFPAIAIGVYDVGTRNAKTNFDVFYIKAAKTIKVKDLNLGRFSLGYFWGNNELLLNKDGARDNEGVFWAWERTMTEINDKLWVCIEYQATESIYGAFNLGGSWQFTKNISVLGGYQFYNNKNYADTFTVQVDINF
jgi:hypothetical protein